MTGLRPRERDLRLPAESGEPHLRAPGEEDLARLVTVHLLGGEDASVAGTRLEYARWKPGVSITCAYVMAFDDGEEAVIGLKCYADGKARSLAKRIEVDERVAARCERFAQCAALVGEDKLLWVYPFDRGLRGLPALFDRRFLARMIEEAEIEPPRSVRRRRLRWHPLRYKPERRALWRLDVPVRHGDYPERPLLARVVPPGAAGTVVKARTAFESAGGHELGPQLLAADERNGILLEEWLELETFAPDSFAHAREAGMLLARLHSHPCPPDAPVRRKDPLERLRPLFALDAELEKLARGLDAGEWTGRRTWTHGDVHPDQIAYEPGPSRWLLLDLDLLGAGDPKDDLASWIADRIFEDPDCTVESAATDLLAGYREAGGPAIRSADLHRSIGAELARRGAAAVRRLERGAIVKATRALERARDLLVRDSVVR